MVTVEMLRLPISSGKARGELGFFTLFSFTGAIVIRIGYIWEKLLDPASSKPAPSTNANRASSSVQESQVREQDEEMCQKETTLEKGSGRGEKGGGWTSVEDALTETGFGRYSQYLLMLGSVMLLAMGMDLFGASFTVAAAVCDLQLTMAQRGTLSAIPFIGVLAGAHLWGYISDTRGRKPVLLVSMGGGFLLASLSSLAPDWRTMAAIKFFSTCFTSATNSAAYTLVGESLPAHLRSRSMMLMACTLVTSQAVSAMLAYPILKMSFAPYLSMLDISFRPWRLLAVVLAAPCGISTALLAAFFHESPKFLAGQGREQAAMDVLRKIYAANTGNHPDSFPVKRLQTTEPSSEKVSLASSVWRQTAPLFRVPLLKRTAILFYLTTVIYMTGSGFVMWLPYVMNKLFAVTAAGRGAGLNICGVLDYTTNVTVVSGASDIPPVCNDTIEDMTYISAVAYGLIACFVNVVLCLASGGRKRIAVLIVLCCVFVSCILINVVKVAIAGVAFFFIIQMVALAMGTLSVYFVELYPTSLRGMVSCLSVMVGRAAGFVGVNILGTLLVKNCEATFYGWSVMMLSAIAIALFLPKDKARRSSENS